MNSLTQQNKMAIIAQSDSMEPVLLMQLILSWLNKCITAAQSRLKFNKHNDEGSFVFKYISIQILKGKFCLL